MKIAIISDTHIPANCKNIPEKLASLLSGVSRIIHAGDITEAYVLDDLKKIAPTDAVAGNMDSQSLKKDLPVKRIIRLRGFKVGIIHGDGAPDNVLRYAKERFKAEKLDCVIYGHSHCAKIDSADGTIYFNPGSPTDNIFAPFKSFGILDIDKTITPKIIRL